MRIFFVIAVVSFVFSAQAQIPDTLLSSYAERYATEKMHLHFDRSAYLPGETVWYKSYLKSGIFPSEISKNLYADWYDEEGKLIKHTVSPIILSTASGNLEIPATYKGKAITVKAYTQWMLNFDTAFIFSKTIPVMQKNVTAKNDLPELRVDLFPEGGQLVVGLPSKIAFKATDQYGRPLDVKAELVGGKEARTFRSTHRGMGSFMLSPEANTNYAVQFTDPFGRVKTVALPAARANGVIMSIVPDKNKIQFTIQRGPTEDPALKQYHIMATLHGQRIYQAKVNLNNDQISGRIPVEKLPDAVVVITLFNNNWQPVAERAVFVRRGTEEISTDVKGNFSAARRAKNEITLALTDTLKGSFSMSVTDADAFYDSSTNIYSELLLSGEVKGKVHDPAFYFRNTDDTTIAYLDLVMQTHGWRKIMWKELVAGNLPKLWFEPEQNYMNFGGNVFGLSGSQMKEVGNLTAIFITKDSARSISMIPVKPNGSFSDPGMLFFDTLKVYYQFGAKQKQFGPIATVKFNSGLRSELYKRLLNENTTVDLSTTALDKMNQYAQRQEALQKLLSETTLEAVTVRTRQKSRVQILDDKYTSGLFSGGDAYQFDIETDISATGGRTVMDYLQGRVPGLSINSTGVGSTPAITWRDSPTQVFIDEMPTNTETVQFLNDIPLSDVAYIKVIRPPFMGAMGGGAGGAIAIYTKRNTGMNSLTPGLSYQSVAGYTTFKQFFSPDYEKDPNAIENSLRTTVYWNPNLFFDRNNTDLKVRFFNNDSAKRLRVVIEGMDEEGKVYHYERIVQ